MTRVPVDPPLTMTPWLTKLSFLRMKDFTAFGNVRLEFSPGVNVIVGENGLGKTHILKAAYCLLDVLGRGQRESGASVPSKKFVQTALSNKLRAVFKPEILGRLARRRRGVTRAELSWGADCGDCSVSFTTKSNTEVAVQRVPAKWLSVLPTYLPPRELMSIYPGFVSLYETTHLEFDETLRDTCLRLGAPLAKGPREAEARALLGPLEEAMGGKVELDESGRFYLRSEDGRIEMHLVAEGHRKLAAIARLIAVNAMGPLGTLFWDEPESNLHPRLIRQVAATIAGLARAGMQVFLATHSLFLLRELEILQTGERTSSRYFGLRRSRNGVAVAQGDRVDDLGDIGVLDEQLAQSKRYLELGG